MNQPLCIKNIIIFKNIYISLPFFDVGVIKYIRVVIADKTVSSFELCYNKENDL